MKIYPTITTVTKKHFLKLEEAQKLQLKEVCFFLPIFLLKKEKDFI